jgi:NADH-quinone oxidoreductase subunit B
MRQSDVLLIEGQVAEKMARVVRRVYDQMPDPKYVIATGNCAISGGFYYDSYSMTMGVDRIVPVDVFVPGCPPRPEDWIDGLRLLQRKIGQEEGYPHQ